MNNMHETHDQQNKPSDQQTLAFSSISWLEEKIGHFRLIID